MQFFYIVQRGGGAHPWSMPYFVQSQNSAMCLPARQKQFLPNVQNEGEGDVKGFLDKVEKKL